MVQDNNLTNKDHTFLPICQDLLEQNHLANTHTSQRSPCTDSDSHVYDSSWLYADYYLSLCHKTLNYVAVCGKMTEK